MTRDFWRAALIVLAILYLGALVREADESNQPEWSTQ